MKKKFIEVAINELENIEGFNTFIEIGIDDMISYLYKNEEYKRNGVGDDDMDEFQFEQEVLYWFNCKNEHERNQVKIAAEQMYPYYKL